jgi:YetA-like protein
MSSLPGITEERTAERSLGSAVSVPLFLESEEDCLVSQPVTVGIPFVKGSLHDPHSLGLCGAEGRVPLQTQTLARWSDGSVKWLLLDFLANGLRKGTNAWTLAAFQGDETAPLAGQLRVTQSPDSIVVETGCAEFHLDRKRLQPFTRVKVAGEELLEPNAGGILLTGAKGRREAALVEQVAVESHGPVRATVRLQGRFMGPGKLRFVARLCFYAGTGLARLALTVHNPRRARHPGGLWDLGDRGSVLFRDLSLELQLRGTAEPKMSWTAEAGRSATTTSSGAWELYQDSSGGENWKSTNHVNRDGRVPVSFRGYRVRRGGEESSGLRASPVIRLEGTSGSLAVAVPEFWQQFPKALEVADRLVCVRLFPGQFDDLFELQGGEQKTHTVWLDFSTAGLSSDLRLEWVHRPARTHAAAEWYAASGAIPYLAPMSADPRISMDAFLVGALDGGDSFFAGRECIDEYGWRNYGDVYADHEALYYKGAPPVVSHYNNQYDVVYGTIVQYLRSGDPRWVDLFAPLTRHAIDIDIYHTECDRAAYNGGMFWHTDHYRDAATSGHRAYSVVNKPAGAPYGGGPCNEHNYTTGLLHYYYLTGDTTARDAVIGLANWVGRLDDGTRTILGVVDDDPTGMASSTTQPDYHGPGRGCGNSVNALLDGWLATGQRRYLDKAEALIRRCVHPDDDVAARDLLNVELRWSYTVFLSVLARYLDLKAERGELDYAYAYARASLLRYAGWMLEHEEPYFAHPEKLEYPTETWAAQEFRKANVLRLAAVHAEEPLRSQLLRRANELAERGWNDLHRCKPSVTVRARALLFVEGMRDRYFRCCGVPLAPAPIGTHDFGQPKLFIPQRRRVLAQLKSVWGLAGAMKRLTDPRKWWRFLRRRWGGQP